MRTYDITRLNTQDRLERALFGAPAEEALHELQLEEGVDVVQEYEPTMPREVYANASGFERKEYEGDKSKFIGKYWNFAGRFILDGRRVGDVVDLVPIAREIHAMLLSAAPVSSVEGRGHYKRSFQFVVNGEGVGNTLYLPRNQGGRLFIGITNNADYASTLEKKQWPRIFRKVYAKVRRKFRDRADTRFRYLKGGTIRSKTKTGELGFYALPMIEIAPFGAMGRKTGVQIKAKRWSNRRERRNDWKGRR